MNMTYFVSYKLYNGDNKGWAFEIVKKTEDREEAIRKFGELIKTYYGVAPFVFGNIKVEDMYGNEIENKYWDDRQPEPTPEVEE